MASILVVHVLNVVTSSLRFASLRFASLRFDRSPRVGGKLVAGLYILAGRNFADYLELAAAQAVHDGLHDIFVKVELGDDVVEAAPSGASMLIS